MLIKKYLIYFFIILYKQNQLHILSFFSHFLNFYIPVILI